MIIDELSSLLLPVQSTDELPIERGELAYKVTYNNLVGSEIAGVKSNINTLQSNVTTLQNTDSKIESSIAIIINGNQTTHTGGVAIGEFVLVRNSTISGITDGLYKAAQAIPANTAITRAYLTAVDGGGLNAINNHLTKIGNIEKNTQNNFSVTFTATEAGTYLIIVRAAPASGSDAIACEIKVNNSIIANQMCPAGTPLSMACCAILSVNDVVSLSPNGSMNAISNDYRTAWQVIRIG